MLKGSDALRGINIQPWERGSNQTWRKFTNRGKKLDNLSSSLNIKRMIKSRSMR
jgi:hypothetical protein